MTSKTNRVMKNLKTNIERSLIRCQDNLSSACVSLRPVSERPDKTLKLKNRQGFGLNEVIGIAAGIIIAGLVIIPGLMTFANTIIASLEGWWSSISSSIFKTN